MSSFEFVQKLNFEPASKIQTEGHQVNFHRNHKYNKIIESDWLSPAMIRALIGQCN